MDEKKLKKVQAAVRLGVNPTDALLLQKLIDVEELAVKLEQLLSGIDTVKLEYIKGDDGYTPIKGTDYVDGEDGYTPIKGKDYFDGEDGKTPTKDELVALIKPLIEKPEQVDTTALVKQVLDQVEVPEIDQKGILDALTAQIPQLGMSVRDALELLPEGEKLLTSSIEDKDGKNLDIIIEELKKQTGKTVFAGGGARAANQISLDTTNFAGNLSAADDTVQKALDTLDDMVGGGGGTWGSITGTLSNQTDLQSALDAKAASSHTHTASQITDFDTEVSNNTDVAANTAARHDAVTVADSAEIDFTLTGQDITASLKAGSIDETKLDTSVNASLDLADSALQNIVEDTTPQLGGNLDTQGYTILGGTSTTADLTLQTTSGIGATGADMHFKVGDNGATEALTILNSGNVGIGTNTPTEKLDVTGNLKINGSAAIGGGNVDTHNLLTINANLNNPTTYYTAADVSRTLVITAPNSQQVTGGQFNISLSANPFNYTGALRGGKFSVQNSNTATVSDLAGGEFYVQHGGTGTITNAKSGYFPMYQYGIGGTVTNFYGVYTDLSSYQPGTMTNTYGVYVGDITHGTQTNVPYSFYASDANARNYFAGNVGIGTTTPNNKLEVNGALGVVNGSGRYVTLTQSGTEARFVTNDKYWFDTDGTVRASINDGGLSVGSTYYTTDAPSSGAIIQGNVGIGTTSPDYKLDINGALGLRATTTPSDPDSGAGVVYMDSSTGDLMTKLNFGGTTKTVIIVDWSAV